MSDQLELSRDEEKHILEESERNIYDWYRYFELNYQNGEIDQQFGLMNQWSTIEQGEIARLGLPLLQFNKLYDNTKKVVGIFSDITPNLQVRSKKFVLDDEDDKRLLDLQKKIDITTNLIRKIAYSSEADIGYQTSMNHAIYKGYGAIKLHYDYENNDSFDKTIFVKPIVIPESAFFDPTSKHPNKIDGEYCGTYEQIDKRLFQEFYPQVPLPESFPTSVPRYFTWYTQDTITMVDYYYRSYFDKQLVLFDTGETVDSTEVDYYFEMLKKMNYALPKIVDKRKVKDYKIMHYKLIKNKILECSQFPSRTILPVIFQDGDSFIYQGRQYTQSFIHHAIDAQRFLNYTGVAIAQALKNTRKEQFLATPEHIRGFEDTWRSPELVQGYLPYNPDSKAGTPPIKLPPAEIPQSLFQHYERAEQDIQSILGVYNQNIAQPLQMNEIATNAKMQQMDLAIEVYRRNYIRMIESVGRCVGEMIPRIFDNERTITTLKHDGTSETVKINYTDKEGNFKNDLTNDEFELSVEAGTSFAVQKQNELSLLTKLVSASPQMLPLLGDLLVDNLDLVNRPQLVERLRTLVPPEILAKEQGKPMPKPQQGPNPAQQMAQAAIQQKQQEIQLEQQKLQLKQVDQQLKERDQQLEQQNQQLNQVKLSVEHSKNMSNERQNHMEHLANAYRSGIDLKGNGLDLLSKLIDSTKPSNPTS